MIVTVRACCVFFITNVHVLKERIKDNINTIRSIRTAMFSIELGWDLE